MKKLSKTEARKKVEEFFEKIKDRSPEEIKKIKKLAMSYNIKLKEKRKLFCKECFSSELKTIGIKNKTKKVRCGRCGKEFRWKV
jgi:RNase P subunit RPR2